MEEYELSYRPGLETGHWLVLLDELGTSVKHAAVPLSATALPIDLPIDHGMWSLGAQFSARGHQQVKEKNWAAFSTANRDYICDKSASKLSNGVTLMMINVACLTSSLHVGVTIPPWVVTLPGCLVQQSAGLYPSPRTNTTRHASRRPKHGKMLSEGILYKYCVRYTNNSSSVPFSCLPDTCILISANVPRRFRVGVVSISKIPIY